jgi:hypothetical protein
MSTDVLARGASDERLYTEEEIDATLHEIALHTQYLAVRGGLLHGLRHGAARLRCYERLMNGLEYDDGRLDGWQDGYYAAVDELLGHIESHVSNGPRY